MKIVNNIVGALAFVFAVLALFSTESVLHEILVALSLIVFFLAQIANNTSKNQKTRK
jgi:hypothetical protein